MAPSKKGKKSSSSKSKGSAVGDAEERLGKVRVGTETVAHAQSYEAAGTFGSGSRGGSREDILADFKEKLQVKVTSWARDEVEFDLVGVEPSLANALRRIMIAEVPAMAIEEVYFTDNTSLIPDEILAQRLGMIPISAHPGDFEWRTPSERGTGTVDAREGLVFRLDVTCARNPNPPRDSQKAEDLYVNSSVYARDLVWHPVGNQEEVFGAQGIQPGPCQPGILIAKLRPGQRISATMIVEKGLGKTHAKWSPVSTASYRLLPEITVAEGLTAAQTGELVAKCPSKVFDIEDGGVTVKNPRACTMCRECIRDPEWKDRVSLERVKNHFLFRVESCGVMSAGEIAVRSIEILMEKLATAGRQLETAMNGGSLEEEAAAEDGEGEAEAGETEEAGKEGDVETVDES